MSEVQELIEKQGRVFEEFKQANDLKLAQIEEFGQAHGETIEKIESITADMTDIKDMIAEVQAKQSIPLRDQMDQKPESEREHLKAYDSFLRNPTSPESRHQLEKAASAFHQKDITISGTGGGNAIPTEIAGRILAKVDELSPIRGIANVTRVSNENTKFVVTDDNDTAGWVGAGSSRTASTTPLVQAVALTYGTVYAYPTIQEEALNDIEFDVMSWMVNTVARRLAITEGTAFVSGDGSDKPTGFLGGTPESGSDSVSPARTFGQLQYFATGVAAAFPNDMATSPVANPATPLFSLVYGVKKVYRTNARWVMNRSTLSTLMQFRDGDGNYLFRPASTAGVPDTLMGYPVVEAEDMSDIGANAFPVAFGDFNEGYQIGDIVNTLRITMDDNITAPGFVKFYARKRVGGKVTNDDAIKLIKVATS